MFIDLSDLGTGTFIEDGLLHITLKTLGFYYRIIYKCECEDFNYYKCTNLLKDQKIHVFKDWTCAIQTPYSTYIFYFKNEKDACMAKLLLT